MPDSIQDIKTFLSQKEGRKEKPFRRMKIMLVGRENVGKTSLRQCLQAKSIKVTAIFFFTKLL
jgi:GTP-binding protein EngB required for normal cell division